LELEEAKSEMVRMLDFCSTVMSPRETRSERNDSRVLPMSMFGIFIAVTVVEQRIDDNASAIRAIVGKMYLLSEKNFILAYDAKCGSKTNRLVSNL